MVSTWPRKRFGIQEGDDGDRGGGRHVITDGEDRQLYTEQQLMQRLREEDVQIFVIGFVGELEKEADSSRRASGQSNGSVE